MNDLHPPFRAARVSKQVVHARSLTVAALNVVSSAAFAPAP